MKLSLFDPSYRYEMENLCRLFFPQESIEVVSALFPDDQNGLWAEALVQEESVALARVGLGEKTCSATQPLEGQECKEIERCLAVALYRAFSHLTGHKPRWGVLTGVRPVKLFQTLSVGYEADHPGQGDVLAGREMEEKLLVSPEKIELCRLSAEAERGCVDSVDLRDFSLYLSIPFCPTRCSYCSFVSHSIEKAGKLVPAYLESLERELQAVAELARRLSLRLKSVYVGGGTPTTLSADQLARLLETVHTHFDTNSEMELTVEAGRPDTLTREKLMALYRGGVNRLAVNPQTLQDHVLEAIGRRHTAQQTLEGFALARECGFQNINMDLIAGLPLDTPAGFEKTLQGVMDLHPEGITVHTLSLKRSARMNAKAESLSQKEGADWKSESSAEASAVAQMLDIALQGLSGAGYRPYYLYRQSKMLGNLENVGWSLPGREGLYNIYMMNELHTVLAAGAGSVTRLKDPATGEIQRVFNFKYPYEYIGRFEEMLERKKTVETFYQGR